MQQPQRHMTRQGLLKAGLAPLVALATTVAVSLLGIHGLISSSDALQSALVSANSTHELEAIAAKAQDINGSLYHALTLRALQTGASSTPADLQSLLADCDAVTNGLVAWRDTHATVAQRPQVEALIVSVQRFRGAVDFVSQMLDVDFAVAISFAQPFDENFRDLMSSVGALVRQVQAQQRNAAELSQRAANTTIQAFEAVGTAAVLLAALAAANMGWAAMRSFSLSRQNRALTQLTQIDALTGVANRRHFDEALASAWASGTISQQPLTLIILDVDHFKKFNDSQGHQAGDLCLRQVAAAVALCVRTKGDTVARYGGEEFVIILPETSLEAGRMLAERVRQAVQARAIPHPAAGPPGIVTISLGLASTVPTAAENPTALVEIADRGLYAAKRGGRNQVGESMALVEHTEA
jgi:diguanylate cyclase (GGDEF)-like protein